MVLYQKSNPRSIHDLQLTEFIANNGVKPREVLWRCKGKCFVAGKPEASITKHWLYIFPTGMSWYVCKTCGAGVIFDNIDERDIAMLPKRMAGKATRELESDKRKLEKDIQRYRNGANKKPVH